MKTKCILRDAIESEFKKTNSVKISIVIPVYNVKRFLPECLDSILAQSFTDFEVICVDDGSTDDSPHILDSYAFKDDRIRIIHTTNGGYGRAVNIGLDNARGEYVGIVESDDIILDDFLATLWTAVSVNKTDIVKSECFFWWPSREYRYRLHLSGLDRYFGTAVPKDMLWLRCQFFMNTWTGLYRKAFLDQYGIRHHESPGASYQDNGFWMQSMIFADEVIFLDYAGYLYRQDNEAASIKDERKVYAMSDEYVWLADRLQGKVSREAMDVVNTYRLIRGYWNLYRIADEYKREFCERLISDYSSYGNVFYRDLTWQERYEDVKDDPSGLCAHIITNKNHIRERLDNASSVVIYGAGRRGERLYRIMCNNGWADKLICFVESEEPKKKKIGLTPVRKLDDVGAEMFKSLVVISAAKDSLMGKEMTDKLIQMGIKDYESGDLMIDNFYLVC